MSLQQIKSNQKANLVITKNLASQIEVLHSQCPENKEWSGLLVYKILEGSIENPNNLKISCENLFLMDFGDATFTSFEAGDDWLKFYELFPQLDPVENTQTHPWYVGKIHSHHQMQSFHSQTDTQDLVDSAPKFPFFLSLVVNYKCQPFAEIGVAGEVEISETRTLRNILFGEPTKRSEKYTYIIPCEISYETDSWLIDQLNLVKSRTKQTNYQNYPSYGNHNYIDTYDDVKSYSYQQPQSSKGTPKNYKKVLGELSELLVLGAGSNMTFNQAPSLVLDKIDKCLSPMDVQKFKSAFKAHFLNWYDEYFILFNSEEEIIESVKYFLDQGPNKTKWITGILTSTLNELQEDVKLLRSVQGHTLV